ncbi:hypothetical protein ACQ4PT_020662 [Festuca glaucescens]
MEGNALALSHSRTRAGSPLLLSADASSAARNGSGISGVPKLDPKFSNKGAGTNKVLVINFEVSHHRAVAAVRLLRADKGKAFVDLLNEKANDSAENEMGYVERTLGFSTRHLDDRDIRLNVRLAKVALRPGAGNMVNAILRKLLSLKETDSLPLPKIEGDDRAQARALSIIYSHPVWMVRRWIRFLGKEEALKLMDWNNSDPYFSLRVNTTNGYTRDDLINRLDDLQVHYEKSIMDEFVRIREGMQVRKLNSSTFTA